MLRNLTLFLFVALCACGSRETKQPSPGNDSADADVFLDTLVSGEFYKRYNGTVGGKPVVAHLQFVLGRLEGSYQYLSQGKAIGLRDYNDTTAGETHELMELVPGLSSDGAVWTITIKGGVVSGEWRDPVSGARSEISLVEEYPQGSMRLQAHSVADSMSLFADRPEGPKATSRYLYLQASGSGMVNELLSRQLFSDHLSGEELSISIRNANKTYFDGYRKDNEALGKSPDAAGFSLNYDQEVSQQVLYNDQDWLVVELFAVSYTGGAHGNYSSSYANIDRASNRIWNLNDVFMDTVALRPLLNEAAIVYFDIKPGTRIGDRLFVEEVPVSSNFYLSATGICFVYNPYEITSYAEGQIKLFIPFTRLQPYLQSAFRERMHLPASSGGVNRI